MRPLLPIRAAMEDPDLLGLAVEGPSWCSMVALCVAAFGEPLNDNEREIFTLLTGREREPLKRVRRFVVVAGRRSGKSYIAACCGIYLAVLCDHSDNLNVGEKGIVLSIAENVEQAKVVFDYAVGIAEASPVISKRDRRRSPAKHRVQERHHNPSARRLIARPAWVDPCRLRR